MAKGTILGIPTSLAIIVLLAGAFLYVPAFNAGVMDLWHSLTGLSSTGIGSGQVYVGNINFVESIQDYLLGTTVDPAGDSYTYYTTQPTGVAGGTALTAAGHVLAALPSGECWMAVNSGTTYYFAADEFMSLNAAYVKPGTGHWADLNDDNNQDFVFALDTHDIGITGQAQTPTMNLVMPFILEDAALAINSPADVAGAGAPETVVPVTWEFSLIGTNSGAYITRLYFTVNETIASGFCIPEEVTLSGGWVGGGGQSYWSAPVKQVEGATPYFYYLTGDPTYHEFANGERYWVKTGEPTICYMTVNFRCILTGVSKGVAISVYYDYCDGGGTVTQDSDTPFNIHN